MQASLTPPPPRNFQLPLWWENGYFLEPYMYISENFAPHFSLKFLSIFVYILGSTKLITLIWVSLERPFLLQNLSIDEANFDQR